ncbi:MAG: hypothetical protein ABSH04_06140 [Acidimicrobiales bacterium]
MVMEQPTTLRVVAAGEIVEAEWAPSGVAGLALVGKPVTTGWRLVHMATGRAVSRSAEHPDPEVVRDFARRIAPLADWTEPNVAVSVPRLRQELEQAITAWRAAYPLVDQAALVPAPRGQRVADGNGQKSPANAERSRDSSVVGSETELGKDLAEDLETLAARLRATEHERVLLRQVVRCLHAALPPGVFADALTTLSHGDRAFVRFLVADENAEDATAVVQVIRRTGNVASPRAPTASATPPTTPPRPAATSQRTPTRPRTPRFGGSDVAAS